MLRILFINRMASMERGGGETFDLEIARHLAKMGHQVTFLSGIPLFGRARYKGGIQYSVSSVQNKEHRGVSAHHACSEPNTEHRILNTEPLPPSTINHQPSTISSVTLRAPMFPWFPWDRVKGGWRVRVAEFWLFEKLAARWAWKHRDQFDIIQVCELPTFVSTFKRLQVSGFRFQVGPMLESRELRSDVGTGNAQDNLQPSTFNLQPKIVLRLTAPNVYDPTGGIQRADAVIASGTSIAKIREAVRPDCHDIPNAVDTERFQVSDCRPAPRFAGLQVEAATTNEERRTKNEEQTTLLYVARFQAFKNHDLLVRAFARVLREEPSARLVLAGSGPLLGDIKRLVVSLSHSGKSHPPRPDSLRDRDPPPEEGRNREGSVPSLEGSEGWVARMNKQVVFLGEVPFDELPQIYAAADIKVISSEYESFCFAAVEGMASGLPVVTTDCGWVPGLIGDSLPPIDKQWVDRDPEPPGRFDSDVDGERIREAPGGLVVGRTDPDSMARAILALLRDERKRRRMGAWNREKAVREHGWESSARKLEAVYEERDEEREEG